MLYLFHGPNTLNRDEDIARMKAGLGDETVISLNFTALDAIATFKEIQAACDAMPFLADRRMIVVRGWLGKAGQGRKKNAKESENDPISQLAKYLEELSDTTELILAEDGVLPDAHPISKATAALKKNNRAEVKLFELPADPVKWAIERAKAKGGILSREAAVALTTKLNRGNKNDRDHFDEDSRMYLLKLDTELEKLVSFANGREVTARDVEALVAGEDSADIFKFADAISQKETGAAMSEMRMILARGEFPLIVLTHIARQTRLLIQAKENAKLTPDAFAQAIGVHPFVAKKAMQQAGRFSMPQLERAHIACMEADVAIKTGQMEDVAALEILVAEFCS
ncbi:MAG: DNA polymerase III subunit delta [Anaerolineae bacterium]